MLSTIESVLGIFKALKNPYIFLTLLGLIILCFGFNFPFNMEKRYLQEFTTLTEETSGYEMKVNKLLQKESTDELSKEFEKLIDKRTNLFKRGNKVSELKGELTGRIFVSQISILAGAIIMTTGLILWIFRDKKKI